jgi:hypothetical protein
MQVIQVVGNDYEHHQLLLMQLELNMDAMEIFLSLQFIEIIEVESLFELLSRL